MVASLTAGQMLGLGSAFAGLGLGTNLVTSAIANRRAWKYTKRAMKLQYEYQKRGLLEGPSLNRKGITDAGYNPLLALGSAGGSIGNVSSPSVPDMTTDMPDLASSAVSALNGYKEGQLLDTNINSAKADYEIKMAQLEKLQSDNKTSPKNLLTNPKARQEFVQGLPKPIKNAVNSALSVSNTENKVAKVANVVNSSMPDHPQLAKRLMSNIYGAYSATPFGAMNNLYHIGKSTYRYIKKIHNKHSAKSGFVTSGNNKYEVEYLPEDLGNSDLLK